MARLKQRAEDVRHGQRDVPTDAGEQAEQRNQDEKGGGESARGALRRTLRSVSQSTQEVSSAAIQRWARE